MGQRCSCLFTPQGQHVSLEREQQQQHNNKYDKYSKGEIHNIEYSKAVNNKRQSEQYYEMKEKSIEGLNTRIDMNISENTLGNALGNTNTYQKEINIFPIINFQSLFRGYITRLKFNCILKAELQQLVKELVQENELLFKNLNVLHIESLAEPYNREGWKKLSKNEEKTKYEYKGTIFICEILLKNGNFYSGQVNIKNQKHGFGKFIKKDGSKLEGYWINDQFTGWGRLIDEEGNLLEGI
jgi:hypothetical protein